jgi:O-antigen ligase
LPISIFITGERSNSIRMFIILFTLFIFIPKEKFLIDKKKTVLALFLGIFLLFNFSESTKQKYTEFFERIVVSKNHNSQDLFENIIYFSHYDVAWRIFKDNPLIGIGSKNFRWECHKKEYLDASKKFSIQRCSTHPHQIHFELLSEQGIIGYILILGILLNYTLRVLFRAYKNIEIFKFSVALYIVTYLLPLLPSGSMFSTFGGSNLWIMLSLLYYLHEVKKDGNLQKNI